MTILPRLPTLKPILSRSHNPLRILSNLLCSPSPLTPRRNYFHPIISKTPRRRGHSLNQPAMSDADYTSFLEKANNTSSARTTQSTSRSPKKKATDASSNPLPSSITTLCTSNTATYTSDADEPFEPVSLSLGSSSKDFNLNPATLAALIHAPPSDVAALSVKEFDPRGEYKAVFEAVERAVDDGEAVGVFRVEEEGARCEYWVVGVGGKGKRVVGVRAVGVES